MRFATLTTTVLLVLVSLHTQAQNLFYRGLLSADARECRPLYNPQTPYFQSNLVGYWNFNGATGVITNGATISSGLTGGASATATIASSTLSLTNSSLSNLNQSVTATGTAGDIISAGTPAALNDLTSATWMMWVKINTGTARRFFYKSDNNGSRGYFFLIDTDNELKFVKVNATTNMQQFACPLSSAYFANSWHQIVVTWDGGALASGVKIYLDGTELVYGASDPRLSGTCVNQASHSGYAYHQDGVGSWNSDATYPLILLGVPSSSSTNPNSSGFSGEMDEFAVWNRALTSTEVAKLYRHQKCN